MDAAKPTTPSVFPQISVEIASFSTLNAPSDASQVAKDNKLKSAYQMKIDGPMYVIAKNEGTITARMFLPHTIQQR